ncbi:MAG: hypothetical protein DI535_25720 [Citrobacter freundii]|nr:MAG: hypothetical protein DI535_25720 [Citrobacter freundii]
MIKYSLSKLVSLIVLLVASSCKNPTQTKSSADNPTDTAKQFSDTTISADIYGPLDSTIHFADSTIVNGEVFKAFHLNNGMFLIRDQYDHLIYSSTDIGHEFRFEDFNKDGYADILATSIDYNSGSEDLLLYDSAHNNFKQVEGFRRHSFVERIGNTKYMSSYGSAGCAGKNWYSDLFYIDHFKAITIGSISGAECEYDPEQHGVFIYKVSGDSSMLRSKLPVTAISHHAGGKMGYIHQYWKNNYMKFIP